MIVVFSDEPSRWQIAETGLAYFEQKLAPVVVNNDHGKIKFVEPFSELKVQKLSTIEIEQKTGASIEALVQDIREKLGEGSSTNQFTRFCRFANTLFLAGVPIIEVTFVCFLIVASSVSTQHKFEFLKTSH